jgi:hypothetical protein
MSRSSRHKYYQRQADRFAPYRREHGPAIDAAFATLGLSWSTPRWEIRQRWQVLYEAFYPISNNASAVDDRRFRDIVEAKRILKAAGFWRIRSEDPGYKP